MYVLILASTRICFSLRTCWLNHCIGSTTVSLSQAVVHLIASASQRVFACSLPTTCGVRLLYTYFFACKMSCSIETYVERFTPFCEAHALGVLPANQTAYPWWSTLQCDPGSMRPCSSRYYKYPIYMHRIHNEFRSPAPRHIVGFYMRSSHIDRAGNVCNRAWLRDHNYDSVRGCPHWPQFILRSSQHNARSLDGIEYLYYLIYDDEYIYINFN